MATMKKGRKRIKQLEGKRERDGRRQKRGRKRLLERHSGAKPEGGKGFYGREEKDKVRQMKRQKRARL